MSNALAIAAIEIEPSALLFFLCVFVVGAAACVGLRLAWRGVKQGGATWSEVALPMAFFVFVIAAIVAGAVAVLAWPYRPMEQVSRYGILQQVGFCIAQYRADHADAWPPTLEVLRPDYLDIPDMHTTFPEEEIVYNPPRADAPSGQIVLHCWPPAHGKVTVLLDNARVLSMKLDKQGRLVDPRTGAVLGQHGGRE